MENINFRSTLAPNLELSMAQKLNYAMQVLKYKLRQLGGQGLIGLLLIVAALLFWLLVVTPKSHHLQQLQMKVASLKSKPPLAVSNYHPAKFDVMQSFYAVLPMQSATNSKISAILQAATDNGLVLNKVEYEQPLSASLLVQYQIKLPFTGSYMQVQQFIKQVLNTLPSIALSELSLRRQDITSELVEARIAFTLYTQKVRP